MKSAPIVSLSEFELRNWAFWKLDIKENVVPDNLPWVSPIWRDRVVAHAIGNHKLNLLLSRPTKESDVEGNCPLFDLAKYVDLDMDWSYEKPVSVMSLCAMGLSHFNLSHPDIPENYEEIINTEL